MPAIPIWLWATGGGFLGVKSLFGGRRDDSLLDDLTPIIAMSIAGVALYAVLKK